MNKLESPHKKAQLWHIVDNYKYITKQSKRTHYDFSTTNKHGRYREELFVILGGKKCIRCGYNENEKALVFDHINDDGYKERKNKKSLTHRYRYYAVRPIFALLKLQVLCANCNTIKAHEKFWGTGKRINYGSKGD